MSRADYEHWNEEADLVWWQDEGCHVAEYNPEPDDDESWRDEDRPDYEDEVEHESEDDCLRDGNFNRPSRTGIWECADCGAQYPHYGEWPPTEADRAAALRELKQAYPDGYSVHPDA